VIFVKSTEPNSTVECTKLDTHELTCSLSPVQNECGKPVWLKFYGPLKGSRKTFKWLIIEGLVAISMAIIFIVYVLNLAMKRNDIILYFLIIIVIVGIVVLIARFIYSVMSRDKAFERLVDSGALDWDIYDKGILTSSYSKEPMGSVKKEFIPFKNISKVYINIGVSQVNEVLALIREEAQKSPDFKTEDYIIDDYWRDTIQNRIYFIGVDGRLIDFSIDKEDIVEQKRFEVIVRQNIKDVI
jgi:hypothetical protein